MSRIRSGTGSTGTVAPGLHGTGIGTVTVKPSGQTLTPGTAAAIKTSPNLAFDVQVMNQGQNDEKQVRVRLSITGAGKPIVVTQTIPSIAAGQTHSSDGHHPARRRSSHRPPGHDHGAGPAGAGREKPDQQQGHVLRRLHRIARRRVDAGAAR